MTDSVAVVAGVGPGLGASVARRFAEEGCSVALFARSESFVESLAAELDGGPGEGLAVPTDLTDPEAVTDAFERVRSELGPVDILVNNASSSAWKGVRELSAAELDDALATGVRGAFVCTQEAVDDMLEGEGGTVIFTGATSAVRGREGAVGFSAAKFAARGMAESMARELGPEGVHVAHVVVDGGIRPPDAEGDGDGTGEVESLDPDAIADAYWYLVEQDRSAWTLELDLRPNAEEF
ncbi:SDR family NAD(P)-dependent oxidoreductase [Halopelagius longus]|uniref:NADP-dependent 3-hydroxy acid dehydrogenase YdfG n=1 Tax=Halopelagius longus TaxID=1236180 RepID=A0A1H1EB79_9EURY|nr:SDR family NAD(P)-dependent oxidoreductase [Halopelagius longus]RDI71680.1 SDR family NAD(P)-dependent oxidoreductase [Halopelagius longus]SDQ85874.1 NADP-dependent 3-hydroxy acid dehydrogenase YdfG [Halopelagius longus]